MEKINPHLKKIFHINEKEESDWENLLLNIKNAADTHDKNSRNAAFLQILKDLSMFSVGKRIYTLKKFNQIKNKN